MKNNFRIQTFILGIRTTETVKVAKAIKLDDTRQDVSHCHIIDVEPNNRHS